MPVNGEVPDWQRLLDLLAQFFLIFYRFLEEHHEELNMLLEDLGIPWRLELQ